jgi:fatty-acyl-CoA synthase
MNDRATQGTSYSQLIVDTLTRYGKRPAFVQDERIFTYAAASDLCGRMARVLAEQGVRPGSGVGALSPNRVEVWLAQAATYLLGARYTGLHPVGTEDDQLFVCDDAELEVLIVDPTQAERGAALAARTAADVKLLTLGPSSVGTDLLALCDDAGPARLDPGPAGEEDIAWLQYTGGTTGVPKGVMLPHRAMVQQVQSSLASFGVPRHPVYLAAAPITHSGVVPVMPTLVRGGTVILHQRFDPGHWLRSVEQHRVSYALAVPTMIYALMDAGEPERYDLSTLETVVYGAAPMSPSRLAEAQQTMGPVFLQAYGQTECVATATTLLQHEHDPVARPELLLSCGRAVVGAEVRVLDADDAPASPGAVGEVCVRSRTVMSGYWKLPQETDEALRGGWLRTGDLAKTDDEGYLYVVDRKKDLIISGGFNIYPKEIEDVLSAHPSVAVAAVIGVPDAKWGEAVKAVVVPRAGQTIDTEGLIQHVRATKGPHHAPKSVDIVESVPLTAVGKVDKKTLRAPFWSSQSRQVN